MFPARRERHGFIVPAYGDSPWLDACLASLSAQTSASPILVTTSTPSDAIAASAARVGAGLIVNPERRGIAADWNFALAQAPWPFVTLAHQDDVYRPDFAARSLAVLERFPRAAIAFTAHEEQSRGTVNRVKMLMTFLAAGRGARSLGAGRRFALLAFGNPVGCSAVTFARPRLDGFSFEEGLASNLDWAAWWHLHMNGYSFAYVPERLVARRFDGTNATAGLLADGRRAREDELMFRRIWPAPIARVLMRAYRLGYC